MKVRTTQLLLPVIAATAAILAFGISCTGSRYGRVEIVEVEAPARESSLIPVGESSAKLDPIARYGGYVLTQTTMPQSRGAAYLWAKNMGTLVAYESFLRRYPDGGDAKFFLDAIREKFLPKEEEWHKAWLLYSRMEVIEGAICDPEEGFILLGRPGRRSLPPFLYEDLIAALRCVIADEKVGVTMTRIFKARFDQPDDPRELPYEVYETSVEFFSKKLWNTHLAYLLFEGDRMLKTLSAGYDIFLQEPVQCRVPGFRTIVDMETARPIETEGVGGSGKYGRIWIELTSVRINTTEKKNVAMFSDVELQVRSESKYRPPLQFAKHLRDNYAAYGEEFAIFAEVERAARVVAIARWLAETYPDVAQQIVDGSYENVKVFVPQVIPAKVAFTKELPHYKSWLVGGVVFPNVNKLAVTEDAKVGDTPLDEVQAKVLASRGGKASAWEVPFGDQQNERLLAWNVSKMKPPERE